MTNNYDYDIGRVVLGAAGRDRGRYFVVIDVVDSEYVLICNGKHRTIEKPKKKKVKHLKPQPTVLIDIKKNLEAGMRIFDAQIRKNLEASGYKL